MSIIRTRWAAIGAAVAVTFGAGGIGIVSATQPNAAVTFVPITPCRVMDTRIESNVGPKTSPLGSGEVHTVNTTTNNTGNCTGIPTTASGVSLNITAVGATLPTFLTVWATGAAQPHASSLNPFPGSPPTPNAVTTAINTNGQFDIYNLQGNVQVIADINGYYTDHYHDDRYYTKNQTDDRYYTKAQVDALVAELLPKTEATDLYALKTELGTQGILRWAYVRDLDATVEVYVDDESIVIPTMSATRTATGVYEVVVPGVNADGGYHAVLVSAQQGQTTVFRACKVFQTVSLGDAAKTLVVRVRCYDQNGALQNSDFNMLVLQ